MRFEMYEIRDPDEAQVVSLADVRAEAISAIRDLLAAELRATGLADLTDRYVEIADADGTIIARVSFHEAIMPSAAVT
jgi:hypothetical protein